MCLLCSTAEFMNCYESVHDEMWRVEQALQRIVGKVPAFMRPPYGSYNNLVRQVSKQRGQTSTFPSLLGSWRIEFVCDFPFGSGYVGLRFGGCKCSIQTSVQSSVNLNTSKTYNLNVQLYCATFTSPLAQRSLNLNNSTEMPSRKTLTTCSHWITNLSKRLHIKSCHMRSNCCRVKDISLSRLQSAWTFLRIRRRRHPESRM